MNVTRESVTYAADINVACRPLDRHMLSRGSRNHFGSRSTHRPSVGNHGVCVLSCGSARSILNPPAPSFESLAQRTSVSAEWLEQCISTTNRGLDNPSGMPNMSLLDYQVKQVGAYLLSLRKSMSSRSARSNAHDILRSDRRTPQGTGP